MLYMPMSLKRCRECGEWKPNDRRFFAPSGRLLRTRCRGCENARQKILNSPAAKAARAARRQQGMLYLPRVLKACSECKRMKPDDERNYPRWLNGKNGRHYVRGICRECVYKKNVEYYRTNEGRRERAKEQSRSYYQSHKQARMERHKLWKKQNRIRVKLHSVRYDQKRRTRLANCIGSHSADDIQRQYHKQQGRCFYCQTEVGAKYHVDHYIPLAKHGSNGAENIVIACPTCNMSKGSKMPDIFLAELKRRKPR